MAQVGTTKTSKTYIREGFTGGTVQFCSHTRKYEKCAIHVGVLLLRCGVVHHNTTQHQTVYMYGD